MKWEEYEMRLAEAWAALLASDDSRDESNLQAFLERHPCLVPGAHSFPPSGHTPFPGALVSQPRLQADGLKIPDFMWIAFDSATIYPVLVEIETPHKRWFTQDGKMHNEFTAAYNQLAQWAAWFDQAANRQVFINTFGIPTDRVTKHRFQPQFVLVHGSREETDARPELAAQRAHYNREHFFLSTFQRLTPEYRAHRYPCAVKESGGYRLLAVPPTLQFGPGEASDFALFRERESAIDACQWMDAARKTFLKQRIGYWDDWSKNGRGGIIRSGDRE